MHVAIFFNQIIIIIIIFLFVNQINLASMSLFIFFECAFINRESNSKKIRKFNFRLNYDCWIYPVMNVFLNIFLHLSHQCAFHQTISHFSLSPIQQIDTKNNKMSGHNNNDNLYFNDETGNNELEDDINNATISFVPQIGGGSGNKNKNNKNNQQQPPALGYGNPPPSHPNAILTPPNYYNNQYHSQPQIMMGQPVVGMPSSSSSPMMDYQAFGGGGAAAPSAYPGANQYMMQQQQPMMMGPNGGAMILLVQESQDLDFRAPLCACNSCFQCINAWVLPYCLLARQQNMLNKGPIDAYRVGPPSISGIPAPMDTQKVEDARNVI